MPKLSKAEVAEIRAESKRVAAQPVMGLDELMWFFRGCADPPRYVAKRTAWRYTTDPTYDFPAPFAELSAGKVWKTTDVERWQRKHKAPFKVGRKKGT
jgi:hypothetical protein